MNSMEKVLALEQMFGEYEQGWTGIIVINHTRKELQINDDIIEMNDLNNKFINNKLEKITNPNQFLWFVQSVKTHATFPVRTILSSSNNDIESVTVITKKLIWD
jgi:hypothetical protein